MQGQTRHLLHLDEWKCGVTHKWLSFIQFGLVLFGLVLVFEFIIRWEIERPKKTVKEFMNEDEKVNGRA